MAYPSPPVKGDNATALAIKSLDTSTPKQRSVLRSAVTLRRWKPGGGVESATR